MENLETVREKLLKIGYNVYLTKIENIQYLRGGLNSGNLVKDLAVEIWIKHENNKFIFLDIEKQRGGEKSFSQIDELIDFLNKKYSI